MVLQAYYLLPKTWPPKDQVDLPIVSLTPWKNPIDYMITTGVEYVGIALTTSDGELMTKPFPDLAYL